MISNESVPCPGCGDPDWHGWYCDECDPNADHPPNQQPKETEVTDCKAVLNVNGEQFACTVDGPHPGLAHANDRAGAVWCSDAEAREAQVAKGRGQ